MARIVDTSRARCRTCGKPYKVGEALYSLASRIVDEGDQRFLEEFEHANCHVPIEEVLADLKGQLAEMTRKTRF
jgi:hypothetical protein